MGAGLAALVFLGAIGLAAVAILRGTSDDGEAAEAEAETPTAGADDASEPPAEPAKATPTEEYSAAGRGAARSFETTTWTTDATATLEELARTWTIPRDVLVQLNPGLSPQQQLEAGTTVIVHAASLGGSSSIGPPNQGRLSGGVPLPEDSAWLLPPDRTRAFATTETIAAVTNALDAYALRFPDAAPVQVGELSARRGGEIYGHQSHQSGRDIDIRLIAHPSGRGFDGERNWFLVKTLLDAGDVGSIFLNAKEQTWLRAAAEADVGAETTEAYFMLIDHEPGHTIHMHVRFNCPAGDGRCVGYSQPGGTEPDPRVSKLPPGIGGKPTGKTTARPTVKTTSSKPTVLKPKKLTAVKKPR
jgi:murein endopeptidase